MTISRRNERAVGKYLDAWVGTIGRFGVVLQSDEVLSFRYRQLSQSTFRPNQPNRPRNHMTCLSEVADGTK